MNKTTWQTLKFGDIAQLVTETVKDPIQEGIDKYVGLEHLTPEDMNIVKWGNLKEGNTTFTRRFQKGDVLFGRRRAYQKKAAVADFEGVCSGDILVFRAKRETLTADLLPFIVQTDSFFQKAVQTSAGSLSPRTKFKDLEAVEIKLPVISDQPKLIDLFHSSVQMTSSYKELLNRLRLLYGAQLKELIAPTDHKTTIALKDLITLHYGKGLVQSQRNKGPYNVVSSSGVSGAHDKYLSQGPGVIIGRKGSAGHISWVDNNFWAIDTTFWVEVKDEYKDIPLRFMYHYLKALSLNRYATATAVPGLSRDDVYAVKAPFPELSTAGQLTSELDRTLRALNEVDVKLKHSIDFTRELANKVFY